jgi:hypothetical protein
MPIAPKTGSLFHAEICRDKAHTSLIFNGGTEEEPIGMRPEHDARRAIIREWMALPKEKRRTEEHAAIFAKKAVERVPSGGDRYRRIMGWLSPRLDRP